MQVTGAGGPGHGKFSPIEHRIWSWGPRWQYENSLVQLAPGDRLLLFTGGITEACKADGEQLGEERLMRLLEKLLLTPALNDAPPRPCRPGPARWECDWLPPASSNPARQPRFPRQRRHKRASRRER